MNELVMMNINILHCYLDNTCDGSYLALVLSSVTCVVFCCYLFALHPG